MSRSIPGLSLADNWRIRRLRRARRFKLIRRRSIEDGLLGGSPKWIAIGLVTWTAWALQQAWRKESEVVYRTHLKAGESLVIRSGRPGK